MAGVILPTGDLVIELSLPIAGVLTVQAVCSVSSQS